MEKSGEGTGFAEEAGEEELEGRRQTRASIISKNARLLTPVVAHGRRECAVSFSTSRTKRAGSAVLLSVLILFCAGKFLAGCPWLQPREKKDLINPKYILMTSFPLQRICFCWVAMSSQTNAEFESNNVLVL